MIFRLLDVPEKENDYKYRDECPDFPCEDVMEKENRYMSQYTHRESPLENLRMIREIGMDAFLEKDENVRAGIEVMVKDHVVVLGGEINSSATVDFDGIVRRVYANLDFPANHHLTPSEINVVNLIGKQSPEISRGVDKEDGTVAAGDQGFCVSMASNETEDYMPLGMHIAKKICQYVASQTALGFGPDCKSQVITVYDEKGHASRL